MSESSPRKEDIFSKNKIVDGITYFYSVNKKKIVVGEYGDNPHDVNSAAVCSIQDLIDKNENGLRCRNLIMRHFGEETLNKLIKELTKGNPID